MSVPLIQAAEVALGRQRAPQHETGEHIVQYLRSANIGDGFLDLSDVNYMNFTPSEQATFSLRTGDVLVTEGSGSRDTVGSSGVWRDELPSPICFQNTVLRIRPRSGISDGTYLSWWMRHAHASGLVAAVATGANILHLGAENLRRIRIDLPPLDEQSRIADFLDDQVTLIDQAAVLRQRQMVLLETRLRSWLESRFSLVAAGRVPLKALVPLITSGPRGWGEHVGDTGWPFLRVTNTVRLGLEVDRRDLAMVDAPPSPERERTRTRAGDVLVSITADLGAVALIPPDLADANVSQHVALLRPDSKICDSRWLAWTIQTPMFRSALTTSGYGGTKAGLGLGDVGSLRVPAIPLERQEGLALGAAEANDRWKELSAAVAGQIRLLEERKRALITAAVTGEFDVATATGRGVA